MRSLAFFASLFFVAACGGSSGSTSPADMAVSDLTVAHDMTFLSRCGKPGDKGNSKGVGQYCDSKTPCPSGLICSAIGNDPSMPQNNTFFCTIPGCNPDMGAAVCGEDTVCVYSADNMIAACVPASCAAQLGMDMM